MGYRSSYAPLPAKAHPAAPAVNLFAANGMNLKTGYGKMEVGLMKGLVDVGARVSMTDRRHPPLHPVTIVVGSPEWCAGLPGRKWVYTMSEANRVSEQWVEAINQHCERVLVPCPDLVGIYEQSGVVVPVECVPLGVDWRAPKYTERDPAPKVFRWLTYSLGDMRKAADMAILAFNRLFGGDPRHKLIIKCRDNPQWLTGLQDEQIDRVEGQQSEDEYQTLLASCHAMIFPSRGEGFGYPPREGALSGMPVVATEALGMWDVGQWGYALKVKEMTPAKFDFWEANAEGSLWWEPDWGRVDPVSHQVIPGDLDAHLLAITRDYPAALAKAKAGREYLLQNFTWEQTARRIIGMLRD